MSIDTFTNNAWQLSSCYSSRRKLLDDGDVLTFERINASQARLAVVDRFGTTVLGRRVVFDLVSDELIATFAGRLMSFRASTTKPGNIVYEATFEEGPVETPDEGGDGGPK
jgi:hypothetical protein